MKNLPLVGVSSCLTGARVRYDGKDKFNPVMARYLAPYVQLLPFCPESAAGLGIPRKPIQLQKTSTGIYAVGRDEPGIDVTDALQTMGEIIARVYPSLCGYVVQSRSPSCGYQTTPIYSNRLQNPDVKAIALGNGLFIQALHNALPNLPIINEADLTPGKAEEFLALVQQYQRQLT